jgi:hypothetical protein
MRHPRPSGVIVYRCTSVQTDVAPFFVVSAASVTNSNADEGVASVTTDRSVKLPIGSAPVVENSSPTPIGAGGACIVSRREDPCRSPAQIRWAAGSASRSYTTRAGAELTTSTDTSIGRFSAFGLPTPVPRVAMAGLLPCEDSPIVVPTDGLSIGKAPYLWSRFRSSGSSGAVTWAAYRIA